MSILRIAGAVALTALLATPVRAADPLPPTAKWNVDFGDAHCVAMRSYGSTASPLTLVFKPSPIGDIMQMSVVRKMRTIEAYQHPATLQVDQSKPMAVSLLAYSTPAEKLRVSTVNLDPATYAPIRDARSVRLRSSGNIDATFALTQMDSVAKALDACVVDLRKHWHLGEHSGKLKQDAVSRQPLSALFSSDDYPGVALSGGATGMVRVMMLINEEGRLASCMVTETSGVASLDAQTCIILTRRARFDAAVGPDGKPAKSGSSALIRWKL